MATAFLSQIGIFWTQTSALTKKNLLLLYRKRISTFLLAYFFPLLVLLLLLNIKNFGPSTNNYGIGDPGEVQSLHSSLAGTSKDLVIVANSSMGSDVARVVQQITQPLADMSNRVYVLDAMDKMRSHCTPNLRGVSNCHAVVAFDDSPLTPGGLKSWNYSLLTDQYVMGGSYSVHSHDNNVDKVWLPLQLAVDNAITNSTASFSTYGYTSRTQEEVDRDNKTGYLTIFIDVFLITFFLMFLPIIYHAVATITADRDLGMSHLIDAMGGGAAPRVVSNSLALNVAYMPTWIVSGIMYWYYVFPDSNAAILLFWSILVGIATTNSCVFAAAFFTKRHASSIVVCLVFVALATTAAIKIVKIDDAGVLGCSLFFPAMNFIFGLSRMGRFAVALTPIDMATRWSPPPSSTFGTIGGENFHLQIYIFWICLIFQIILYPILAIVAERLIHGISFKGRTMSTSHDSDNPFVAVETSQLKKIYRPSLFFRYFCCEGRSKDVTAVDGVDLVAQKNQILCLLGVNGSGKTTTLDLIGGTQSSTAGQVKIHAPTTKLGICPQRNVFYPQLTVYEHIRFWSEIKGGGESKEALHEVIRACDLTSKMSSRAGSLSGGQKRKLQLACMFVGGSTVCLMDEVTTGLDPLSRRVIWDIILAERSKRSMLFTTHFLDEGEVLADHIVLLSKGKIKCQGSVAQLKNEFGGGYSVHVPFREGMPDMGFPATRHQDRLVYNTPDSKSAGILISKLEKDGHTEVALQGPTIESVFLRLTTDVEEAMRRDGTVLPNLTPGAAGAGAGAATSTPARQLMSGKAPSSFRQILALMRKRFIILPRYWIPPLLALFLPGFIPSQMWLLLSSYETPACDTVKTSFTSPSRLDIDLEYAYRYKGEYSNPIPWGPRSANDSLWRTIRDYPLGGGFNLSDTNYASKFPLQDNYDSFRKYIETNHGNSYYGGVYMGDDSHPATVAYEAPYGVSNPLKMSNLLANMRSTVPIGIKYGSISYVSYSSDGSAGLFYIIFIVFLMSIYPCFFALYPAYEKAKKVRALQYANGVRPFPLWISHLLFDFIIVALVSLAFTITIGVQFSKFWFAPGYMFLVSCLYGLSSILISYLMARLASSQLAAFFSAFGIMMLIYILTVLAFALPPAYVELDKIEQTTDAISFSLGLIFPTVNLWKALAVGINLYKVVCRNTERVENPGSIYAYGGPILLLIIQVIYLTLLIVWLESNRSFSALAAFFRRHGRKGRRGGAGKDEAGLEAKDEIAQEAARVEANVSDLLRLTHVTKAFGSNVAVDDVSLGLGQGEILALLGPNGAGKTTIANMIMGELVPDSGAIFLRGIDVGRHTRLAQQSLGVCPQFDALDLMTARQHLDFYGRIRGVPDVKHNVDVIMDRVGLAPHADKAASKLSGGNKRKLSLAIALIGNPDVLILDEPSSAMDAAAKRVMWKLLAEAAPGRSVLLTTHSMEEADALATRAAILAHRLLAIGTTEQLRQRYSNMYHVTLVLRTAPESDPAEMRAAEQWVAGRFAGAALDGASLGGQVRFSVPAAAGGNSIGRIIEAVEGARDELGLADYAVGAATLERVFLSVVRENEVEEEDEAAKKRWWQRRK